MLKDAGFEGKAGGSSFKADVEAAPVLSGGILADVAVDVLEACARKDGYCER